MAEQEESMKLVSPSMQPNTRMPRKHTSDGHVTLKDISPALEWYNVPPAATSLALVAEDIDEPNDPTGPSVPWTHWVVINIPPELKGLPEGFSGSAAVQQVKEGHNDWKVPGWRGPVSRAASGHRIQFRLYALEGEEQQLGNKVTREKLLEAIQGRVLAQADFVVLV